MCSPSDPNRSNTNKSSGLRNRSSKTKILQSKQQELSSPNTSITDINHISSAPMPLPHSYRSRSSTPQDLPSKAYNRFTTTIKLIGPFQHKLDTAYATTPCSSTGDTWAIPSSNYPNSYQYDMLFRSSLFAIFIPCIFLVIGRHNEANIIL